MTLLRVEGLVVRHGLLTAVREVDLAVAPGEVVALVGANGAGKSTLLHAVAGSLPAAQGRVLLGGEDVTTMPAHQRVRAGISLVPEGRRLFPSLSVLENLLVGVPGGSRAAGPATSGLPRGGWDVDRVLDAFPVLARLRDRPAGLLSGGEQQATAIGRALVADPALLLLDEVSLGLSPAAVDVVYASLEAVLAGGVAVVLVEQDIERALRTATRIVCLLEGRVTRDVARRDADRAEITRAYFGTGTEVPS
ncbi:ABC transporter ATP-binding protein [Kineosporia sp. R_H_3]|uniref:ABC transporter ATP-binding protein n=1 Tax=Kineosporia sp. R_H_3 TaxID=1961848 RepID=UPI000B4C19FD|nr:ABC transporter ATP-binding protein [Kineosporia sp. R_H_3]